MLTLGSALNSAPPLAAIFPVVILIIALLVSLYFIEDLYKPERRVYGGDKTLWLVIILFGSIVGCAVYLLFGRES